jgi:hypothetical protein
MIKCHKYFEDLSLYAGISYHVPVILAVLFLISVFKSSHEIRKESVIFLSWVIKGSQFSRAFLELNPLQPSGERQEILVSLSYLPSAERLTVVLLKARNLYSPPNKDSLGWWLQHFLYEYSLFALAHFHRFERSLSSF